MAKRQPREVKTLRVDRAIWYRGRGGAGSALLTPEGEQCCLGFFARALGYKKKEIDGFSSPEGMPIGLGWPTPNLFPYSVLHMTSDYYKANSEWTTAAIRINDNPLIYERERERALRAHFKKIGIKLVFHGRTPQKLKQRMTRAKEVWVK